MDISCKNETTLSNRRAGYPSRFYAGLSVLPGPAPNLPGPCQLVFMLGLAGLESVIRPPTI